ncbi:Fatty acid oxidation complex subunit alpha [Leucobacter aridicollis]|uniref:3-hydroxyacyl-CoA dehydrogenase/enoyl-CoA hydratase/carnithine racemase n=1 Tax=Leucobacter aridicollis TaxID=283878 RepID=A0A852RJB9_9MICO|nr:3-hydroxyacyl-CoA dehydrogenase NAD-binding domain-containing protein [Leucobacter aridicollis]MBL3682158.1 3-hydroxyacyl-CoA dehydrogenase [Leucobacter aridicollis]NYD26792.1 3-hydroxyacyl-CoA dehydrogenase/enoyl-CoA hydratase/carnithine racemase [Leucobacter aridicollis]RKQ94387.1 3-hydroxyacyl-CoA dehydrogenase [Mycolicibacterium mucogenicum 261Sha1.1M5]
MTDYSKIDFSPIIEASADEVVTESYVRDVKLPSGGTLALITLDNGRDYTRPNTLGPRTLQGLERVLDELTTRASAGEIQAVAVTGKQFIFAAGADLSKVSTLATKDNARLMGQYGHRVLGKFRTIGVPSFAFVNGLALGGALEIALNCTYRTVDSSAAAIAFPEVFLGIIPGWGGATLLPNLIGIENALKVIVSNPLQNNRMLKPKQALELGIFDEMFGAASFLEQSVAWADGVLAGTTKVERPNEPGKIERMTKWPIAIKVARDTVKGRLGTAAKSPYAAIDLLAAAKDNDVAAGFAREDEALAELISGDQFAASIYAFDLVQKRAKRPAGAPDKELAKKVQKVGIIGAGLMASQFALLFARKLRVPVVITDLDQGRVDKGVAYIHGEIDKMHGKGRLSNDDANQVKALVTGTTDKSLFADCDWVIEAVFEELSVKQQVFAEIEPIIAEDAILATNTSSLSVEQIGANLKHPERLVGFHFFNPVAVMPLIEVVKSPATGEGALSTAMVIAKKLGKSAIITADRPGFVVNRLLAKVMGEAARALDEGTPLPVVEQSLAPIGLPMGPFELIDLVGWKVAAHVQDTMVGAFPDRFYASPNMHAIAELDEPLVKNKLGKVEDLSKAAKKALKFGKTAVAPEEILRRVEDELANEIKIMLDEGVVHAAEDIDLGLILGAGWPFQAGGATPYLDRVGASERAFGGTFHDPRIAAVS